MATKCWCTPSTGSPPTAIHRRHEVAKLARAAGRRQFELDLNYRHHREDIVMNGTAGSRSAVCCGFRKHSASSPWVCCGAVLDAPIEDRHRNLAWATQAVYEDSFFHLLNTLQRRSGQTSIALAGGCAYNSVANGKIKDRTAFRECYLQSAAGDAGGAIGAAFAVWHRNGARTPEMTHAFWGPSFTEAELAALLADRRAAIDGRRQLSPDWRQQVAADTMRAARSPMGLWTVGFRAAWNSPGAFGNRSILATRAAPT